MSRRRSHGPRRTLGRRRSSLSRGRCSLVRRQDPRDIHRQCSARHPRHLRRVVALPLHQIFLGRQRIRRAMPPHAVNLISQHTLAAHHLHRGRIEIREVSVALLEKLQAADMHPGRDLSELGRQVQPHNRSPHLQSSKGGPSIC